MSQTTPHSPGLSRRTAVTGILTLAASASPALAISAASHDAALLQVVAAGLAAEAAHARLCAKWGSELNPPESVERQERILVDALSDSWDKAGVLHASTLAGLQAKARLALTSMCVNSAGIISPGNPEFIMWSLCRDLIEIPA
ncbi:hypothetical protein [Acetobacter indonesiensis]|uniref:Uncharacterized protein n=1 Tax=Acetobacter indonesiensis TaxID=104101 RepID=A0A252AKD2_9PROT|nr:hypothetical protein [Acetobacter indonesiensis]OUI90027.1 hypothetical protein HK17_14965 [Acetobacter indonesiensis]